MTCIWSTEIITELLAWKLQLTCWQTHQLLTLQQGSSLIKRSFLEKCKRNWMKRLQMNVMQLSSTFSWSQLTFLMIMNEQFSRQKSWNKTFKKLKQKKRKCKLNKKQKSSKQPLILRSKSLKLKVRLKLSSITILLKQSLFTQFKSKKQSHLQLSKLRLEWQMISWWSI